MLILMTFVSPRPFLMCNQVKEWQGFGLLGELDS